MKRFKNILVAVDTRFEDHPALQRAVALADHIQARLKLVDVVPEFSWLTRLALQEHEDVRELMAQEKRESLEALAESIRAKGIDVTTRVLFGKTSIEIIREVLRAGHDLVVRVTKGKHSRRAKFFGTTSTRLLRKCPCPLLLIKPDEGTKFDRILGAIQPAAPAPTEEGLNRSIMDLTTSLAEFGGGECHAVQAWDLFGSTVLKSRMNAEEFRELEESTEAEASARFDEFLAPYGLSHKSSCVHLLKGDPALAIPTLVKEQHIDLIVMGTLARTGIPGMLIGNTAEMILDQVECSVLTLKPDGFVSPVTLEES